MTRYDRVKEILDLAVQHQEIGAHRAFWRNRTRDEFVEQPVFGRQLVTLGDGAGSTIIKALRGLAPFGADIGTPGAIYRRMPAGFPPVPDNEIAFIETWIDDECPEDRWPPAPDGAQPQGLQTPQQINDYFRALDNWALFQATTEVSAAVGAFFGVAEAWLQWAKGQAAEGAWTDALGQQGVAEAVALLGGKQEETVRQFFGTPLDREKLGEAYEKFGDGTLPQDPLRPNRRHQMDGEIMWFMWLAFSDAAERLGRDASFWKVFTRAILLGACNDGVFRQRYAVHGFSRDEAGRVAMRAYFGGLGDAQLGSESRRRFADSGLG